MTNSNPTAQPASEGRIERLAGPRTHICWTPDGTPLENRVLVSLVREGDLHRLETAALAQPATQGAVASALHERAERGDELAVPVWQAHQPVAASSDVDLVQDYGEALSTNVYIYANVNEFTSKRREASDEQVRKARTALLARLASRPATQASPTAWMRGVYQPSTPSGPAEHDVDLVYGDDQPEGKGWLPLYREPPAAQASPAPSDSSYLLSLAVRTAVSRFVLDDHYNPEESTEDEIGRLADNLFRDIIAELHGQQASPAPSAGVDTGEIEKDIAALIFECVSKFADADVEAKRADLLATICAALDDKAVPDELRKLSEAATPAAATVWPSTPEYLRQDDRNGWGLFTDHHRRPGEAKENAKFAAGCWNWVRSLLSAPPQPGSKTEGKS